MAWLKRIAAPKNWPIERKSKKFITVPRGPHSFGIPLSVLLRDMLKVADSAAEAKSVIKQRKIMVDGKPLRDIKYGVGMMDIVTIPDLGKSWRATPLNGYTFVETSGEDAKLKICKIMDKKNLRGGKTQINITGGRNILTEEKYRTGDSLLLEMPEQKIKQHLPFEEGAVVMITSGKRSGIVSKIKKIERKNKRVWLETKEGDTEVPISSVMVVGKDRPAVKLE